MKNSDQPAFPEPYINEPNLALSLKGGLTKREYFAAMAMQGLLSNPQVTDHMEYMHIASNAIYYADQLLKQIET